MGSPCLQFKVTVDYTTFNDTDFLICVQKLKNWLRITEKSIIAINKKAKRRTNMF